MKLILHYIRNHIGMFLTALFFLSLETAADLITMLINCIISFWVYFPILKIIFRK